MSYVQGAIKPRFFSEYNYTPNKSCCWKYCYLSNKSLVITLVSLNNKHLTKHEQTYIHRMIYNKPNKIALKYLLFLLRKWLVRQFFLMLKAKPYNVYCNSYG